VRAVSVVVVRNIAEADEVGEIHDAPGRQIVVLCRDARVDRRDTDSRPIESEVLGDPARADRGCRAFQRAVHGTIEADGCHVVEACQRAERRVGDTGNLSADRGQVQTGEAMNGSNE